MVVCHCGCVVCCWCVPVSRVPTPTRLRVESWSFSFMELLNDSMGRREFMTYLEKEFSGKDTEIMYIFKILNYLIINMCNGIIFHSILMYLCVCALNPDGYHVRFDMVKKWICVSTQLRVRNSDTEDPIFLLPLHFYLNKLLFYRLTQSCGVNWQWNASIWMMIHMENLITIINR